MTTKEIAKELYLKMLKYQHKSNLYIERNIISPMAKECALVCINEMLDFRYELYYNKESLANQYLLEIKEEIEKL